MKLVILAFTIACAAASSVEAKDIWLGPQVAFPIPAQDIDDTQLGVDAGVTFTHALKGMPYVGVGMDLAYHYWPASPEYQAAYDRYLRSWFQTIDSSTWAFSAFQVSAHLKLIGPNIAGHAPWVQLGAGMYRLNRNLAEPNWEGSTVRVVGARPKPIVFLPGWHGSIGVDFRASSTMVVGLNATYHSVLAESEPTVWGDKMNIPGFSAFTVGTHILFGK